LKWRREIAECYSRPATEPHALGMSKNFVSWVKLKSKAIVSNTYISGTLTLQKTLMAENASKYSKSTFSGEGKAAQLHSIDERVINKYVGGPTCIPTRKKYSPWEKMASGPVDKPSQGCI
jgi:hypothetical protein